MAMKSAGVASRPTAIMGAAAAFMLALAVTLLPASSAFGFSSARAFGKYILLMEQPDSADSVAGFNVLSGQQIRMLQYVLINLSTCQGAPGSWAINTSPVNGAVSTGTITKYASGGYCPGVYFNFAAIYYTWTSSANGQNTDSLSATWSEADYSEAWTFDFSLLDADIGSIGKTMGDCGCNPGDAPSADSSGGDPGSSPAQSSGNQAGDVSRTRLASQGSGSSGASGSSGHSGNYARSFVRANTASGNLFEQATDYTTAGANRLELTRYYNGFQEPTVTEYIALSGVIAPFPGASSLGAHWRTNYDRFLAPQSATTVAAERPDGRTITFTYGSGGWSTDTDVGITLATSGSNWILTDTDDTVETYATNSSNQLLLTSITARGGYTQTLAYNGSGQITAVTDSFGRSLSFTYSGTYLTSVATPDGTTLTYGYSVSGMDGTTPDRLASVTYATTPATTMSYVYENSQFPYQLTGIIDENGVRFATWGYDSTNRLTSSQHAGGADLTTTAYNDTDGSRTVTNALGETETFKFAPLQNVAKVTEIDRAATSTTAAAMRTFAYDANGYQASATDWNGNLTTYVNNARGLPTHIVEASGTSQARTTAIAWHPRFHLPLQIATAGLTTSFGYDPRGELTSRADADTTDGASRSWAYSWSRFNLTSVTGPRTDVAQTTQMSYDGLGRLATVTDALGHVTRIPGLLGGGLPTAIVDPNGVTTRFTYDARQRPLSQSVITAAGPLTTSIAYDAVGDVVRVTLPDGSFLANSYDPAHRLIGTADALGESIAYALDAMGDRTQTTISTSGGTAVWQYLAAFDALGRKIKEQRGAGQTSQFAYDGNGNLVAVLDPLNRTTSYGIDALNRVALITDPAGGQTALAYDAHDRPIQVAVANGAVTGYVYDGFGRVTKRASPDTATTLYAYDLADDLTQMVDGAGVTTRHAYDALNRVISASYPADAAETVIYNYDESGHGFGIGRLTSMSDAVGTLGLTYDERGNRLSEARASGSVGFSTLYGYDAASREASVTYPSGYKARYVRDAAGQVSAVALLAPGASDAHRVATGISYAPFGPMTGLTYGNGIAGTRALDGDYRITSLAASGALSLGYSYDAADRVTAIADNLTSANSQSFGYDVLDHLTAASGVYGSYAWTYDLVGNRLSENTGGSVTAGYSYVAGSNRLMGIAGGGTEQDFAYTGSGNIASSAVTGGTTTDLAYNQAERLASVASNGNPIAAYAYDGFGRWFSKALRRSSVLFSYDPAGRLLEEATGLGAAARDIVYLNGVPLAQIMPAAGTVAYLHPDRLGTPQVATNAARAIVWSANYEPFGQLDGLPAGTITQNLRFPGQYADAETGYYHNGFRDYAPLLGRYLESDPIGLGGGVNTYGYVEEDPANRIDPPGLADNFLGVPLSSSGGYANVPASAFPQPPFLIPSESSPGFVCSCISCGGGVCVSATVNPFNIYGGGGAGFGKGSCSIVLTNNMQTYSSQSNYSGGLGYFAGGINNGSIGVGLQYPAGFGGSWTYSVPISEIPIARPVPK